MGTAIYSLVLLLVIVGCFFWGLRSPRKRVTKFQVFTLKPGRKRNAYRGSRRSGQRKRNKDRIVR